MSVSDSGRGSFAIASAMLKAAGIRARGGIIVENTAEGILLSPDETRSVKMYTQEQIAEYGAAESGLEKAVERGGSPEKPAWIPLADEAHKRAALRARDVAIQTNTGILVMVDGKVVKIAAEELWAERDNGGVPSENSGKEPHEGASKEPQAADTWALLSGEAVDPKYRPNALNDSIVQGMTGDSPKSPQFPSA